MQTLVAGANTDQSLAVSAVPRTTYTLGNSATVASATDPDGRAASATYTANLDIATSTQGSGSTAGTTTNTWGANGGYSLTQSTSPTGSTGKAAYANTADATKYNPSSSTDDAGNASTYTYNGAGNLASSTNALAAAASVTYNADGTVATATAPGQSTNPTKYFYNGDRQLIQVVPNTGGSAAVENYTYDALGRLATRRNGRGQTVTYTYNTDARLGSVSFSDGTPTVSYEYNDRGQITKQTDAAGITTKAYDEQGRLTAQTSPLDGSVVRYAYDKEGNQTRKISGPVTDTFTYTPGGKIDTLSYSDAGTVKTTRFAYDTRGRRTDTWWGANAAKTTWSAWSHVDYTSDGKPARTVIKSGPSNTSNTTLVDRSYCYMANTTQPNCTASAVNARAKVQWVKNNLDGVFNTYRYDKAGRLTQAKTNGGSNTEYNYTYDARGNRLTGTYLGNVTTSATYNAQNQLTMTGWTYDADGNTTRDTAGAYTYNASNQMTSATRNGDTYTYQYSGVGQKELVQQTSPTGTYQYTFGRSNQYGVPMIEKVVKDGAAAYVGHDPKTGDPLYLRTSDGKVSEYTVDGLFGETFMIAAPAEENGSKMFDPYGVQVVNEQADSTTQVQNPYTYRFGLYDRATQRYRYGDRQYNPNYGNWAERDTLDSPLDPTNANRYAYAGADPVNNYDSAGLASTVVTIEGCWFVCANAGAVVGDDGVPHFTWGFGAGPKGSVSANIGRSSGDPGPSIEGTFECSAAYYAGVYGQVSQSLANLENPDPPSWEGGFQIGLGGGCNPGLQFTY